MPFSFLLLSVISFYYLSLQSPLYISHVMYKSRFWYDAREKLYKIQGAVSDRSNPPLNSASPWSTHVFTCNRREVCDTSVGLKSKSGLKLSTGLAFPRPSGTQIGLCSDNNFYGPTHKPETSSISKQRRWSYKDKMKTKMDFFPLVHVWGLAHSPHGLKSLGRPEILLPGSCVRPPWGHEQSPHGFKSPGRTESLLSSRPPPCVWALSPRKGWVGAT